MIDKNLIIEAKQKLGDTAALIIKKDLQLENFDEENLKSLCPFHSEDTGSFIWNPKDNAYKCFGCGKVYGILDHYMAYHKMTFLSAVEMLFSQAEIDYKFDRRGVKTQREYNYPQYEVSEDRSGVEAYFARRKISKETLDYCDVQQGANGHSGLVMWNFYENEVLLTVKCRHARKPKAGEPKEWFLPNYDNSHILWNMDKIDPTQPLVITEGMPDCLAVIESGYTNCVSVPSGTENMKWIERCYDFLEQFDKIIIWSDNDEPGQKMRREACSRLGTWRTFYVDLPLVIDNDEGKSIKVKDANEVLYRFGKQAVLDFIEEAKEVPVPNIVDLADVDDFDIETAPGLYTGIKGIDNIIYKLVLGSLVILTGQRGSGKSTLLNQVGICEGLNQGHDVFIFSGEMSAPIIKNWLETTMISPENIKMKNDFVRVFDKEAVSKMRDWYRGRVWAYDGIDNSANTILDRAVSLTRKFGVSIWVLDNILTINLGATGDDIYNAQKEFVVKLINLAAIYNVLIFLVAHPRKLSEFRRLTSDDVAGSGDITNLAQYVISAHRYTKAEKEGEKKSNGDYKDGKEPIDYDVAVDVFKNRYTGKLGECQLYFNYENYRFHEDDEGLYRRYKWDSSTEPMKRRKFKEVDNVPEWAT